MFIDNLLRCALPCAPFNVAVACQARGRLICKCVNGETWDVEIPALTDPSDPPKPQSYARPPALSHPSWYGKPRKARA